MAKKDWEYHFGCSEQTVGLMKCHGCGKGVSPTSHFRYRMGKDGYIIFHRECSLFDEYWAALDEEMCNDLIRERERLGAYEEFRSRWCETSLDEEIEDMKDSIRSLELYFRTANLEVPVS